MRRLISVLVLTASLVAAASAGAITNGSADGNDHPNVGGLVADEAYPDGTWIYCSGTLISPTVFLTAAHCGEGGEVRVTFDPAYEDGDVTYSGTFYGDPLYNQRQSSPHDIAVVVFDEPVVGIEPAQLPERNSLARLSKRQRFTSVGYGAYEVTNEPGGHDYLYNDVRMVATSGRLFSINKSWLRISMNPALGDGGTCYGDSGGPNFLGSTDIVASITITGDSVCRATNVTYRLDTRAARDFLGQYVTLP